MQASLPHPQGYNASRDKKKKRKGHNFHHQKPAISSHWIPGSKEFTSPPVTKRYKLYNLHHQKEKKEIPM